jgi:signal transduction histidine kinase
MDRIVDDVLTLAREGRGIEERESITFSTIAEAAWETVDTGPATLDVSDDADFVADADRLQRALENLFRNAVEHGGADVTVTVEATPDGFDVADDGPGIPEADRDDVFADEFTTNEDGTGFGLSIVQSIVEAHGWTVAVEESETGGAAFVVRDVATISERRAPREQRADDD